MSNTQNKSAFTPGLWHFIDRLQDDHDEMHRYTIIQAEGHNHIIAKTVKEYSSVNDEANARLIAAAPKMYKVLQAIYRDIELQNVPGGSCELNLMVQEIFAEVEPD